MNATKFARCAIASFASVCALNASATVLTTHASVDNGYIVYLSTADNVAGTQFGSGNNWTFTYTDSTTLAQGVDYYLHVYAYDQGGIAGFLGDFSLSGTDHKFSNGLTFLTSNTTDWKGNAAGFNGVYSALTDLGVDGVGPWGNRWSIDDSAHWIWSGNANSNDYSYLSTKISANTVSASNVPEPGGVALLGLGLAGVALARRRKSAR